MPRGEDSGQLNRMEVKGFKPSDLKGIHCHSMQLPSQGKRCCDNRMEDRATRTFSLVQIWLQAESVRSSLWRNEEGGYGKNRPFPVVLLKPVYAHVVSTSQNVAVGTERGIRSAEESHCDCNDFPVDESSFLKIVVVWDSFWVINSLQADSGQPLSSSFLAPDKSNHMAPCLRATPRRGRNYGQRGGAGGRGSHSPSRVSPLAFASPPSTRSDDSGHSISNTVQSARFQFRRRTNKPLISALVTVIFSEEDEEEVSLKEPSKEHSPSPSNNSSSSRWMEDSSYAPSSQSKIEEESTFTHTEEQAEMLQEIGSMKDKNSLDMAQDKAKTPQEREDIRQTSPQKQTMNKKPDNSFATLLYPKLPSGMKLEDIPEGMEITWEPLNEETGQGSENIK